MKKILLLLSAIVVCLHMEAQTNDTHTGVSSKDLTWANIGTPFVVNDVYGNSIDIQSWLDSGFCVIIDYSATWCYPCYLIHTSGMLEALYNQLGPQGENRLRMIWVEIQGASLSSLQNSNYGNWTVTSSGDPVPYPIVSSTGYINLCTSLFDNAIPYLVFVTPEGKYCQAYIENPVILDPDDISGSVTRVRSMLDQYSTRTAGIAGCDEQSFQIYPNPTHGRLNIDGDILTTSLLDMNGKVLLTSSEKELDLSALPQGVYMLRLSSPTGVTTRKIIIR